MVVEEGMKGFRWEPTEGERGIVSKERTVTLWKGFVAKKIKRDQEKRTNRC